MEKNTPDHDFKNNHCNTLVSNTLIIYMYRYITGPPIVQPEPKVEVVQEEEEKKGPTKVELFDMNDDHLQSFFQVRQSTELTDKIDVTVDDMNDLFISANDMYVCFICLFYSAFLSFSYKYERKQMKIKSYHIFSLCLYLIFELKL